MTLIGPAVVGLSITAVFMLALRPMAISIGLIDSPGGRKSHSGEVPLIGGIAMFIGMAVGIALVPDVDREYWYMLLAGGVLLGVGVLDDRYHVSRYVRLGVQAIAALIMVYGGQLVIADIGNPLGLGTLHLGPAAVFFTVLVTVSVINAFNFVDGIDGLAGCLAAVAIAAVAAVAAGWPSSTAAIAVVVCASVVGFLLFNFPAYANWRLRSFMGDAGSTLLGFIVVWLTVCVSQGEAREISPVVGLWFATVPLADLFTCFVRRIAKGRSPMRSGREHFHHLLLRAGLSVRQVLAVLTGLGVLYAAIGLAGHGGGVPDPVLFVAWVAVCASQYWLLRKFATLLRRAHWRQLRNGGLTARPQEQAS